MNINVIIDSKSIKKLLKTYVNALEEGEFHAYKKGPQLPKEHHQTFSYIKFQSFKPTLN